MPLLQLRSKCDCNDRQFCFRIEVLYATISYEKTRSWIINNNNNDEDFGSFATRRFSTLTAIFGHLDGVGSHKNNRYE